MTKREFQERHKLTDSEMQRLEFIIKLFKGKIIEVFTTIVTLKEMTHDRSTTRLQ